MTKSVVNIVISRMRLEGVTVKAWAEANGHKPDTVYKTLYGTRGKAARGESLKIKEGLRRDGYWPEGECDVECVASHGPKVAGSNGRRN